MNHSPPLPWSALEAILGRDPARRGLGSWQAEHGPLCPGHLERAAHSLAGESGPTGIIAIVTGFCVVDAAKPAGETDGPPGALYLARALAALGRRVLLVSDSYGLPLLECGVGRWQLGSAMLVECPFEAGPPDGADRRSNAPEHNPITDAWLRRFFDEGPGREITHLISTERVGPSHTRESLAAQPREGTSEGLRDLFEAEVPAVDRNACHNMRGLDITGYTAKTHRLFEVAREQPRPIVTIGIGDGGNELGLGSIRWETLREAVKFSPAARIACRIATDHTILAGVSDWGAYALAASVCALAGKTHLLAPWNGDGQRDLIEALIRETDAVDGATKLRQATVDGLPLETYLEALAGIRRLLGHEP